MHTNNDTLQPEECTVKQKKGEVAGDMITLFL